MQVKQVSHQPFFIKASHSPFEKREISHKPNYREKEVCIEEAQKVRVMNGNPGSVNSW
jgi:hypothetical protein